jgi:hypothetical protein
MSKPMKGDAVGRDPERSGTGKRGPYERVAAAVRNGSMYEEQYSADDAGSECGCTNAKHAGSLDAVALTAGR